MQTKDGKFLAILGTSLNTIIIKKKSIKYVFKTGDRTLIKLKGGDNVYSSESPEYIGVKLGT